MNLKNIIQQNNLEGYVNDIVVLENKDEKKKTVLPFFADGYPGLMFLRAAYDVFMAPHNKKLCNFFLYGQTIEPVEISISGAYRMIVFQLFPSAIKTLFGVDPKTLNDDCYDSLQVDNKLIKQKIHQLSSVEGQLQQVDIITSLLSNLAQQQAHYREGQVRQAIKIILDSKGTITVKALTTQLHLTERTLQRLFIDAIGISPKQFAKIIQFQTSFHQVSEETVSKLTEIAYENGYADQPHFIRSFKRFTGKKPSQFKTRRN